jgi:hypothetical protein
MGVTGEEQSDPAPADPIADNADNEDDAVQDDERAALLEQAWVADARQRLTARIANDVRQAGAKALRTGGRDGLSEWGESMQVDWRHAGEAMLAPLQSVRPEAAPEVATWVMAAYQAAARELIGGGNGD